MLIAIVVVVVLILANSGAESLGRTIAQFDYQFTIPQDWKQVSSDTLNRETKVKPADAETGLDAIIVQELAPNFDPAAERERAVGALRSKYEQSTFRLSDLNEKASFAGRDVVSYRQQIEGATVDWFVVFDKRAQVSIGCEYTGGGRDRVMAACDQVVRTMTVK